MQKRRLCGCAFLLAALSIAANAQVQPTGLQVVSFVPDSKAERATLTVKNITAKTVTAYAIEVGDAKAFQPNASKTGEDCASVIHIFDMVIGLVSTPGKGSSTQNVQFLVQPGATRSRQVDLSRELAISSLQIKLLAVVYEDATAEGERATLDDIFGRRRLWAESLEEAIDQLTQAIEKGNLTKSRVDQLAQGWSAETSSLSHSSSVTNVFAQEIQALSKSAQSPEQLNARLKQTIRNRQSELEVIRKGMTRKLQ